MFRDNKPYKVRVEFDPAPVRHIAVQCPFCEKWFYGYDITDDELTYDYQIGRAQYRCPLCEKDFGNGTDYDKEQIEESYHTKVYDGCLNKKVKWE